MLPGECLTSASVLQSQSQLRLGDGLQKSGEVVSSHFAGTLNTREGEAWLREARYLFDDGGIELPDLTAVLRSDQADLYCVCRQPDDLQPLMVACDTCEFWYHMHCVGVP